MQISNKEENNTEFKVNAFISMLFSMPQTEAILANMGAERYMDRACVVVRVVSSVFTK